MDYALVITGVGGALDRLGARWALIGGLALASYGIVRATLDVDVVTEGRAQEGLVAWLERAGWETLHRSSGYSNHLHPDPRRGRVDAVYVAPATAEQIFAAARWLPGPGERAVPVACPEHLAAMKVLAIKNDPGRAFQDLADIRSLLLLPGVDRAAVAAQFDRHDLAARYRELAATLED